MTRTDPTLATAKKLFALSRNQCALPTCGRPLIDEGVLVGELCHIMAASRKGPRYEKKQKPAERRAASNFIVLCSNCHKKVDTDLATYTVQKLTALKREHEAAAPALPEPPDGLAQQLVRSAQIAVRVEAEFAIVTFGQTGGSNYSAENITIIQMATPVAVEPNDPFYLPTIAEPPTTWWCGLGDIIWSTNGHYAYLHADNGQLWSIRVRARAPSAAMVRDEDPNVVWDHVALRFVSIDDTLAEDEKASLQRRLVAASPLRRGNMTQLEAQLLDRICSTAGTNRWVMQGSTLRREVGVPFAEKTRADQALARLSPRYVEGYAYGADSYSAMVWGLLESSRATDATALLETTLTALRERAAEMEPFLSFQWSFVTALRPGLTETDRDLAGFMLYGLKITNALGWHSHGSGDFAVGLRREWLEATQSCTHLDELWKLRREGTIRLAWPTCPTRASTDPPDARRASNG